MPTRRLVPRRPVVESSRSSGRSRILETMADAGGVISLSQLAQDADLPLPTIHRLVRTLVDLGYVRQEPSRAVLARPAPAPPR